MGKNKDGRRSNKKNRKKDKFKRNGKNTSRGLRIKQASMEKQSKKKEGDHFLVSAQMQHSKNKGKHGASTARSICKITCKNK